MASSNSITIPRWVAISAGVLVGLLVVVGAWRWSGWTLAVVAPFAAYGAPLIQAVLGGFELESRRIKWLLLGGLAMVSIVALSYDRDQRTTSNRTLIEQLQNLRAENGNKELVSALLGALNKSATQLSAEESRALVDEQAERLSNQRKAHQVTRAALEQLAIPLLIRWNPAAQFIVSTFDAQVAEWQAKGETITYGAKDDLNPALSVEDHPAGQTPRQVTLSDGTIVRLLVSPGFLEIAERPATAWEGQLEFRAADGHDRPIARFILRPEYSSVAAVDQQRAPFADWSGEEVPIESAAFKRAVVQGIGATFEAALTRIPEK